MPVGVADQPDLGKCLKVEFPAGDSVGVRLAKVTDWKRFATLEFDAFNPGKENVKFGFNVAHRRSTNYQTRVEMPFTLKPGKNHVRLGIDEMANVNGVDKPMRYNADMGFVLVPRGQKEVDVKLGGGAEESDKGPYPVPEGTAV